MHTRRNALIATILLLAVIAIMRFTLARPARPSVPQAGDRVQVRWFAGLGTGASSAQIAALEAVAADFNAAQSEIELVVEVATLFGAYDMFATQLAAGAAPDIVGPVDLTTAAAFADVWLPLDDYLAAGDLPAFEPGQLDSYRFDSGTVSLPFAVYPSAIFYRPELFDEASLAYPPQTYGQPYQLDGAAVPWNWDTLAAVARRLTLDRAGYNATEAAFDRGRIAQVGFYPDNGDALLLAQTFAGGAAITTADSGGYRAVIPDGWQTAWRWWHGGIWGPQPFSAGADLARAAEFGSGAVFAAGKAAMSLAPVSATCCLDGVGTAGAFQLAALPAGPDGQIHSPLTGLSFYVWQGSLDRDATLTVLAYLLDSGTAQLLPPYFALPANPEQMPLFIDQQAAAFPAVTAASWAVLTQSLALAEAPQAPPAPLQVNEINSRLQSFAQLLANRENLDLAAEFEQLEAELTYIVNQ